MISKGKRVILYVIITLILTVGGLISSFYPISQVIWPIMFAVIGLGLSFVFEIYVEIAIEEAPKLEVIYGEDRLKSKYRSMREDISCRRMDAIWSTRYPSVSGYFAEKKADFQKNPQLKTRRLINPNTVEKTDYKNHLRDTKDLIQKGAYEIRTTDISEFECVFCEYERSGKWERKALFVFNDKGTNSPGVGIFFDPTKYERISFAVTAIMNWFEEEWKQGVQCSTS